jgi:hypothetical protein
MADFCKECSIEIFGEDFGDLAGQIDPVLVDLGLGAVVLCEGCGFCLVDEVGKVIKKEPEELMDNWGKNK